MKSSASELGLTLLIQGAKFIEEVSVKPERSPLIQGSFEIPMQLLPSEAIQEVWKF